MRRFACILAVFAVLASIVLSALGCMRDHMTNTSDANAALAQAPAPKDPPAPRIAARTVVSLQRIADGPALVRAKPAAPAPTPDPKDAETDKAHKSAAKESHASRQERETERRRHGRETESGTPEPEVRIAITGGDPKEADALEAAGKQKSQAGDYAGAVAAYRAALRIKPSARLWTKLGEACYDDSRFGEALSALKRAGSSPRALLLMGDIYAQQDNPALARKMYERFLAKYPDSPNADRVRRAMDKL